eukprot:2163666-Amphidinium_carterae.1
MMSIALLGCGPIAMSASLMTFLLPWYSWVPLLMQLTLTDTPGGRQSMPLSGESSSVSLTCCPCSLVYSELFSVTLASGAPQC